jgi:hypothetical protein
MTTTLPDGGPASVDDRDRLDAFLAARRRGVDWLLARLRPDGALGDPADGYKTYRALWALGLAGEVEAAHRVAGWYRRNALLPDGRIGGAFRIQLDGWAYRDSAMIVGGQLIGDYDLGIGLLPELRRSQDLVSGGFANDRSADGGYSDDMDIPYACGPGFAMLACGDIEGARTVARFLRTIRDAQPDLPDRFYAFWSRSRQRPIVPADSDFKPHMVVDNHADRMQRWTIGGIAAGFLCRLFLADPDPGHIQLARDYQAFSMAATDAQFKYPSVCKSSWGSSLLYQVTGEATYRDWTLRMGDWYVAQQEPDGRWHPWVEETEGDVIEITLEFVMHLDTLIGALVSRGGLEPGGSRSPR